MTRRQTLSVYLLVVVALVAGSTLRRVGDGGEYLALSLNLLHAGRPWLAPGDLEQRRAEVAQVDEAAAAALPSVVVTETGGLGVTIHFWLYSAMAAPFVWLASVLRLNPLAGFTPLNVAMLAAAFGLVWDRLGRGVTWLVMTGPIIWWIDKAHADAFVFATLLVAFVRWRDAPALALVSLGAASAQYPPIAPLIPMFAAAMLLTNRGSRRAGSWWSGAVLAIFLAALHPLYNFWLIGRPSPFLLTTNRQLPSLSEFGAVLVDPAIGVLANFPGLSLALVTSLVLLVWRAPGRLASAETALALAAGGLFLLSFTATSNLHHGGTPGMSRFALWLIPLALPLIRLAEEAGGRRVAASLAAIALASFAWSAFAFHPKHAELSREPTWLADYLWTRHPGWNNPAPEVFGEINGTDDLRLPVATRQCEKALLIGRGREGGTWPIPCYPAPIPARCLEPGVLCYANGRGARVDYVKVASRQPGALYRAGRAWPAGAESSVRREMNRAEWWRLQPSWAVGASSMLRATRDIARVHAFEGDGTLLLILQHTREGAGVTLRMPSGTRGSFLDVTSGDLIGTVEFTGPPFDLWDLPVPANRATLILGLRRD